MEKTSIQLGRGILGIAIPDHFCKKCDSKLALFGLEVINDQLGIRYGMGFVCHQCGIRIYEGYQKW